MPGRLPPRAAPAALSPGLPPLAGARPRPAVQDFLRGIGFYRRVLQLASSDEGSEEAAAEAAAGAAAQ